MNLGLISTRKMAAPMDLSILWKSDYSVMKEMVKLSFKLGYDCVAINYYIDDFNRFHTSKKKKDKPREVMHPSEVKIKDKDFNAIKSALGIRKAVRQYSRITVKMEDMNHTNKLQRDETIRAYDIIAVRPTSEKIFKAACSTLDIDIISFDLTDKIPFKIKGTGLNMAMERGIVLEICYAPMIRDSGLRRYVISNGNHLTSLCKGKNVILSSECEKPMELRGPYDVQNLGMLFNMKEAQCKDAVFRNPAKCVVHGETAGKRLSKCIVTIQKLDDAETDEQKGDKDSMDYIEFGSDSDSEAGNILKHKSNTKQHGEHLPRKKIKTS